MCQVETHLFERLLPEERAQQVDQRPGHRRKHQERRDDDTCHVSQQLPVGILDPQTEIEFLVGRERSREGQRILDPQRVIERGKHHLRILRRFCREDLCRRGTVAPAAHDIDLVGQVDPRRLQVTRKQRIVARHVEPQDIDRRDADLLTDEAGLRAVGNTDIVVYRVGLGGEGDAFARPVEVLHRDLLNHVHADRVDVPRRREGYVAFVSGGLVAQQQVVIGGAGHGLHHLTRELFTACVVHVHKAPHLHGDEHRQRGGDQKRYAAEATFVHPCGCCTKQRYI